MTRQCVAGRRIGSSQQLRQETTAWHEDVNQTQRGVDWQMKTDDARTKLKSVYPKSRSNKALPLVKEYQNESRAAGNDQSTDSGSPFPISDSSVPHNTIAGLIVGAYHTAGQAARVPASTVLRLPVTPNRANCWGFPDESAGDASHWLDRLKPLSNRSLHISAIANAWRGVIHLTR
jgi:hypothetical protein